MDKTRTKGTINITHEVHIQTHRRRSSVITRGLRAVAVGRHEEATCCRPPQIRSGDVFFSEKSQKESQLLVIFCHKNNRKALWGARHIWGSKNRCDFFTCVRRTQLQSHKNRDTWCTQLETTSLKSIFHKMLMYHPAAGLFQGIILVSVKLFVRNSGAGNGFANFMGTWKNAFFLQDKPCP